MNNNRSSPWKLLHHLFSGNRGEDDHDLKKGEQLFSQLRRLIERSATEYNVTVSVEPLMLTVKHREELHNQGGGSSLISDRLSASTGYWALTMVAEVDTVEAFIIPATELITVPASEVPSRSKLVLKRGQDDAWQMNNANISTDEIKTVVRGLVRDVIARSKCDYEQLPETNRILAGGQSFAGSVRALLAEKHALVQKIVDQQEAIQNAVARDLHDSVLGNVMLLKRSLSGSKPMSDADTSAVLDEIASRLREVCQDLFPRDLVDLGLKPILEELCRNIESRTGCVCSFQCPDELPDFPQEVQLHTYRIAQECLNNVVKHAGAQNVVFEITVDRSLFKMAIIDDGVGYDQSVPRSPDKSGGSGASIIKERAELISCFYPASVKLDSQPAQGTKLTLEIMFST